MQAFLCDKIYNLFLFSERIALHSALIIIIRSSPGSISKVIIKETFSSILDCDLFFSSERTALHTALIIILHSTPGSISKVIIKENSSSILDCNLSF